ncbi:hypothetical protein H2201_004605 [Coniosporium apollinis]|uniref:Glycosyltransferase 2-like domain-containing protein n=1 Tax=Coniosporium apollinis TaxID=61459 RepID=A0ABQ9NUD9_9PEZI|nr:hypothetical protein H2201_004605 [Coniosporium apollinis]
MVNLVYGALRAANSRVRRLSDPFADPPSRSSTPSRSPTPDAASAWPEDDENEAILTPVEARSRRLSLPALTANVQGKLQGAVHGAAAAAARNLKDEKMIELYEKAKTRGQHLKRRPWVQIAFQYSVYVLLVCTVYFVLIGVPLWDGAVYYMWKLLSKTFILQYGFTIFVGIAAIYAFLPLLIFFEKDPPAALPLDDPRVQETCLLIPCYKSASLIENTLKAALKIFPAKNIFVVANGNSPTPIDNTAEVVAPYGVNHVWSPIGSKIVAQFVGCYAAKDFKYILLIDDDCALPPNFPIVSARITGRIKCVGYTIKSVGPGSTLGTLCQQAQDLEYKLSGLQRAVAGMIGSATFPHGAISLWDREFLIKTFHEHPGFSVSEDWFFGHVARKLGSRITMCTSVFVETETPSAVFFSSGGSRGGFGEMTIWKQRFYRWNFFFVNGMWYNMAYILFSWRLGIWELGAKLFVWQEVYETLLYILAPFILPICFYIRPAFTGILMGVTAGIYLLNVIVFNEIHLRRKGERVTWGCIAYYMPYKMVLTFVNILSCYWSIFKYAQYFAVRHPKVIEDERAVEVVLKLDDAADEARSLNEKAPTMAQPPTTRRRGRSMTAEFVAAPLDGEEGGAEGLRRAESKGMGGVGRSFSVTMRRGRGGVRGVEVPVGIV